MKGIVLSLIFFCSCVVIYSCKKDPPCSITSVGEWDSTQFQQYDTVPDTFATCTHSGFEPGEGPVAGYHDFYPSFNPINPNEFCFMRAQGSAATSQLCTYNFNTKQFKVIASNGFFFSDWGSNGWIAFTGDDSQIWKVKANGDSLLRLTQRYDRCYTPIWNDDGSKLIFYEQSNARKIFIIDAEGNYLDSLISAANLCGWEKNNVILIQGLNNTKSKIQLYNILNRQFDDLFIYDNTSNPYGQDLLTDVMWGDDGNVILITTYMMLYYTPNGQLITGKQIGGRTKMYIEGATYANGKIVASRTNRWAISQSCDIGTQTDLYLIDINEQIPRRILLPD